MALGIDAGLYLEPLLQFVQHKSNCGYLGQMWDKEPCNCGLVDVIAKLPPAIREALAAASVHVRVTLDDVNVTTPADVIAPTPQVSK